MTLDSEITIIRQIEIPEASISQRSDGIVLVHYRKNTVLDVELQIRTNKIYKEIAGDSKLKFIFSADEGFILTKEAREYGPIAEETSPVSFYAIIANNLAYKIVANFYIRVTRPKGNHKVFATVEGAIKWLNSINDSL